MSPFTPGVYLDHNRRPVLVFARGRLKYHAVEARDTVRLVQLDTLRGLVPATLREEPYPPRRAASYWLNHSAREITPRARAVLRTLVARRKTT